MKEFKFEFEKNGTKVEGEGELFDNDDLAVLNDFYNSWKTLNRVNMTYGCRRSTLPELLSEGLASALFGYVRTNNTSIKGLDSSSCDLIDINSGETIQLKACSTTSTKKPGPTSFGPRTQFDRLIFLHLDCDKNIANFYNLDAKTYKQIKVNKTETIADQQQQGRRPRVVLLSKIQEENIKPFFSYQFGG